MSVSVPRVQPRDDPHSFRIRAARRGDAAPICQLIEAMGYVEGTDNTTVSWMVSHPETEIYVAADMGDRVVGLVTLSHRPALRAKGRIAFIDELVVAEAWRRKGVGRALLHHAVERARVLTVKRLEVLHSQELGEVPRAFFESCGLQPTSGAIYRAPGDFTERRS